MDKDNALIVAADWGREEVVELLIQHGANVNIKDSDGVTPLVIATRNKFYTVLEVLLRNGANMNLWDDNGKTALDAAIGNGNREIVKMLLSSGAEIKSKSGECDVLLDAVRRRDYPMIKILINAGAKSKTKANKIAEQTGDKQMLKLLKTCQPRS